MLKKCKSNPSSITIHSPSFSMSFSSSIRLRYCSTRREKMERERGRNRILGPFLFFSRRWVSAGTKRHSKKCEWVRVKKSERVNVVEKTGRTRDLIIFCKQTLKKSRAIEGARREIFFGAKIFVKIAWIPPSPCPPTSPCWTPRSPPPPWASTTRPRPAAGGQRPSGGPTGRGCPRTRASTAPTTKRRLGSIRQRGGKGWVQHVQQV